MKLPMQALIGAILAPGCYIYVPGENWSAFSVFYMESGRVEEIIAAVAKDLTPLTLPRLRGKSPVILDPSYDLEIAASTIMSGNAQAK